MTVSHAVLSALAAIVAGGSVAIVTQAGMPPQDLVSIPWDKLLGVGSGGLAFGVAWYFLQREERLRVAHDRVVSQHLETASKISGTFAETVNKILAEARTDTDRREARLIALLQDKNA